MRKYFMLYLFFQALVVPAQVINTGLMDTTNLSNSGKVTIGGYVDAYYAYDFNNPHGERPYFVSMSRQNEVTINLALIDLKYTSPRVRARLIPAFGTYMNSNYKRESGTLKNVLDASAGIKIIKSKLIWLDVGVLGSPYTNESAISKDHLTYTRSFGPEYVPYYLSGVRLTLPLTKKVNTYFYIINGWQQIEDSNSSKSIGTQVEYRPAKNWLLNWNTYIGDERSTLTPDYRMRYFTDLFFIYSNKKWTVTSCFYVGVQNRESLPGATWWQGNIIGRYAVTEKLSVSGRVEYFNDSKSVMIKPVTGIPEFKCFSSSLGLNSKPVGNIILRLEWRGFYSALGVFERIPYPTKQSNVVTANVAIWF